MKANTTFFLFSYMKRNWKQSIARFSFCFIFLFVSLSSFSQYRQAEYNLGAGAAYSMVQTKDGGYALAGHTNEFQIVKLDSNYNLKWAETIGSGNYNEAYSLVQTKDGGYAMAGYSEVYGAGGMDVYVVKIDASGNLLWTKTIGGPDDDWGNAITETKDGGLAITGGTKSYGGGSPGSADEYVIKLDSNGNKKWTKTIEGPWGSDIEGNSIIQTKDGGLSIVATETNPSGGGQVFVIKLDSIGNLLWAKSIGGVKSEYGYSIIQADDGGFAISGSTLSYGAGNFDVYVIKLDSVGDLIWTKTIGGTQDEEGESIIQTKDKGYAITGGTNSFGLSSSDIYVIKLDSAGSLIWANTFGGAGGDIGYSIVQTKDYGYAVAGWDSTFIFLKIDSSGNSCTKSGSGGLVGSGGVVTNGGTITSSNGGTMGSGGVASPWGSEYIVCQSTGIDELMQRSEQVSVSPNPSGNGKFSVVISNYELVIKNTIEIYNVLGEKIYSTALPQTPKGALKQIDLSSQPSGVYLYRITTEQGDFVGSGKLIIKKA